MIIFFVIFPKRKEHSNDFRSPVIRYFQNEESQREIATKTLLPRETARDIINKYKRTRCIGNLFGRGRKRKTTATIDRTIQRILKKDRQTSAEKVNSRDQETVGYIAKCSKCSESSTRNWNVRSSSWEKAVCQQGE